MTLLIGYQYLDSAKNLPAYIREICFRTFRPNPIDRPSFDEIVLLLEKYEIENQSDHLLTIWCNYLEDVTFISNPASDGKANNTNSLSAEDHRLFDTTSESTKIYEDKYLLEPSGSSSGLNSDELQVFASEYSTRDAESHFTPDSMYESSELFENSTDVKLAKLEAKLMEDIRYHQIGEDVEQPPEIQRLIDNYPINWNDQNEDINRLEERKIVQERIPRFKKDENDNPKEPLLNDPIKVRDVTLGLAPGDVFGDEIEMFNQLGPLQNAPKSFDTKEKPPTIRIPFMKPEYAEKKAAEALDLPYKPPKAPQPPAPTSEVPKGAPEKDKKEAKGEAKDKAKEEDKLDEERLWKRTYPPDGKLPELEPENSAYPLAQLKKL